MEAEMSEFEAQIKIKQQAAQDEANRIADEMAELVEKQKAEEAERMAALKAEEKRIVEGTSYSTRHLQFRRRTKACNF